MSPKHLIAGTTLLILAWVSLSAWSMVIGHALKIEKFYCSIAIVLTELVCYGIQNRSFAAFIRIVLSRSKTTWEIIKATAIWLRSKNVCSWRVFTFAKQLDFMDAACIAHRTNCMYVIPYLRLIRMEICWYRRTRYDALFQIECILRSVSCNFKCWATIYWFIYIRMLRKT